MATNTEANTILASTSGAAPAVEAKSTAPSRLKEFSMSDASKESETKPVGSGATKGVAPDEKKPVGNAAGAPALKTTSTPSPSAGREKHEWSSAGVGIQGGEVSLIC